MFSLFLLSCFLTCLMYIMVRLLLLSSILYALSRLSQYFTLCFQQRRLSYLIQRSNLKTKINSISWVILLAHEDALSYLSSGRIDTEMHLCLGVLGPQLSHGRIENEIKRARVVQETEKNKRSGIYTYGFAAVEESSSSEKYHNTTIIIIVIKEPRGAENSTRLVRDFIWCR